MSLSRRTINSLLAGAPLVGSLPLLSAHAQAQSKKDTLVLAMILEPTPGLDPTMASAAAIGEIVHYNIFEGLTKIAMDGAVTPLLADNWYHTPDGKTYTFTLKKGVKFSDGAAFDAGAVKFSFDRARAAGSTNKAKKAVFDNISSVVVVDALGSPTLAFELIAEIRRVDVVGRGEHHLRFGQFRRSGVDHLGEVGGQLVANIGRGVLEVVGAQDDDHQGGVRGARQCFVKVGKRGAGAAVLAFVDHQQLALAGGGDAADPALFLLQVAGKGDRITKGDGGDRIGGRDDGQGGEDEQGGQAHRGSMPRSW